MSPPPTHAVGSTDSAITTTNVDSNVDSNTDSNTDSNADPSQTPDFLSSYVFPAEKLGLSHRSGRTSPGGLVRKTQDREPLILVACGSFSPITYLHLRLFELAKDWARLHSNYEPVAGYLSPVGDAYKKAGLASAGHRIEMCRLAVDHEDRVSGSSWVTIDEWEALHSDYLPTAVVLDHFRREINDKMGGIEMANGVRKKAKIVLLAGADLLSTMSTPGLWSESDLDRILTGYGAFIVEREGTDIQAALANLGKKEWQDSITVIDQAVQNDVSSTKIRQFLKQERSIRYLVPGPVIEYIERHNLYVEARSPDSATSLSTPASPDKVVANSETVAS